VSQATVSRINPWILVAIVATLIVLASALLVVSEPGMIHALNSLLQSPARMAPVCNGAPTPC
jgi:hypothetical protein